jgi:hypothetical protein
MRHLLPLTLVFAMLTLLGPAAQAQVQFRPTNAGVFSYQDPDGSGTFTLDFLDVSGRVPPLTAFSRVRVSGTYNTLGETWTMWGSGTWDPIGNAQVDLYLTLYASSPSLGPQGPFIVSGTMTTGFGPGWTGEGTEYPVGQPNAGGQWTMQQILDGGGSAR